jgi:hypothetical protein
MKKGFFFICAICAVMLLVSCSSKITPDDVSDFIKQQNIKPTKIISQKDYTFIFYRDSEAVGVFTLKGKKNSKFIFGRTAAPFTNPIFLGGLEKDLVAMVINDDNLLNNSKYFVLHKNDAAEKFAVSRVDREYVIHSPLINSSYDFYITFIDGNGNELFTYGNKGRE